jgi:peptidoglycan/xylan/chitin deacetylase (PgdA/CDA1 family)
MYHSISDSRQETTHPYYRTVTSLEVFACHMNYLHDEGYSVVNLREAVSYMESSGRSSTRPVVITFDDGYQDFYTNAFPIINRHNFGATVYLPTAYIGTTAREFKGTECLTWDQVRELRKAGIEFGSHTVTHPQLKSVTAENVKYEVRSSKDTIEQELGCPVTSFAYPYAFPETDPVFTRTLRGMLEEAGYENGVSTIIGTADRTSERFFLERLPINSFDDPRLFQAKLNGAYDWLHTVQRIYKAARG